MYRARVGDVVEYKGYMGIIIATPGNGHPEFVCLDWLLQIHPEYDFRNAHPALGDWCVPNEHLHKFKLICNVGENNS